MQQGRAASGAHTCVWVREFHGALGPGAEAAACAAVFIWRAETEASVCLPRARGSYTPCQRRLKCSAFETFRASTQLCTVAAFVPAVPDLSMSPPAPFSAAIKPASDTLSLTVRFVALTWQV